MGGGEERPGSLPTGLGAAGFRSWCSLGLGHSLGAQGGRAAGHGAGTGDYT